MEREIGRFRASDTGDEFIVIEYQRFDEQRDLSGDISITKGLKRLILIDGSSVNQIE
jgi:hypothetical protein